MCGHADGIYIPLLGFVGLNRFDIPLVCFLYNPEHVCVQLNDMLLLQIKMLKFKINFLLM